MRVQYSPTGIRTHPAVWSAWPIPDDRATGAFPLPQDCQQNDEVVPAQAAFTTVCFADSDAAPMQGFGDGWRERLRMSAL